MATIDFSYSVTYEDENGTEQSEQHTLRVDEDDVKEIFQQAMRGSLDGVDKDTLFTELSYHSKKSVE